MYRVLWKSICPLPDSLCFCMFVTHKCFRSSNRLKYKTKITQVSTRCSFNWWFSILKGKKTIQTYMAFCEKVIAPLVKSWANCGKSQFLESWVKFHWPHPGLITARPVKPRDHLNRTCLTWAKRSQKERHHAMIHRNSGTDEKQSNWHLSVWKWLQSYF